MSTKKERFENTLNVIKKVLEEDPKKEDSKALKKLKALEKKVKENSTSKKDEKN